MPKRYSDEIVMTKKEETELALKTLDELLDEKNWQRAKTGNLWRHWRGMNLTVFNRSDGYFCWCIADGDETRFSSCSFETELEAKECIADVFIENYEL